MSSTVDSTQKDKLPTWSRQGRTRKDSAHAVWEPDLLPLLQRSPHLRAVTLLEELQRRYPGEYGPSALRTLQRRLRQWRAMHGREREMFFAQEHPPGRQGLSDFTRTNDLGVTIGGQPFDHMLYQFAPSGWRSAGSIYTVPNTPGVLNHVNPNLGLQRHEAWFQGLAANCNRHGIGMIVARGRKPLLRASILRDSQKPRNGGYEVFSRRCKVIAPEANGNPF
jgi:hypothetical protein